MKKNRANIFASVLLAAAFGFGSTAAHAQKSIIDTVNTEPSKLTGRQLDKYNWYKANTGDQYDTYIFCRMHVDSTKFDSLGRFVVSLPSVLPRSLVFNTTHEEICSRAEIVKGPRDIEAMYYQGQHFHYPENDRDTLFGYAEFRFLRSGETSYSGNLKYEHDHYELNDLGDNLQLLCRVKSRYYDGKDCIDKPFEASFASSSGCGNKIRILLIYTKNAMSNIGAWHGAAMETPEITQHAWACISDLNTAWANSGISGQAELAAIKFLEIGETGDPTNDVEQTLPNSSIIAGWRSQYNADIVCQFTGHYSGIFGEAAAIGANASNAFAIVDATTAHSDRHTFAHEMGHLFGCSHNTEVNNTARGHDFKTGANSLGMGGIRRATLMDVSFPNDRILHYSNPNASFMNVATGTSNRNSAEDGVIPFTDIIDDFYPDHDLTIRLERINCTNYKDWWWTEAKDVCLEGFCEPFTYEWYGVELTQWFPIFNLLGTGNQFWMYIPYNESHNRFIIVMVKDCHGDPVFAKSQILTGWDASGNCLTYRTAATGIAENKAEDGIAVIPNPNGGTFVVKSENTFSDRSSVAVFDALGREVKDQFTITKTAPGEIRLTARVPLPKGLYVMQITSGQQVIKKKIVIE